jgi:hypothetical protein
MSRAVRCRRVTSPAAERPVQARAVAARAEERPLKGLRTHPRLFPPSPGGLAAVGHPMRSQRRRKAKRVLTWSHCIDDDAPTKTKLNCWRPRRQPRRPFPTPQDSWRVLIMSLPPVPSWASENCPPLSAAREVCKLRHFLCFPGRLA